MAPEASSAPSYERLSTTLGLGASKLKMHVVDVEESGEEREVDLAKQREAEEAKMALIAAVSKKKKAEAKLAQERAAAAEAEGVATTPAVAATGAKPSWKDKIEAKKAAEAAGGGSSSSSDWSTQNYRLRRNADSATAASAPPNLNSVMDFPMLPGQAFTPSQSSASASAGATSNARLASSNIWSALGASGDDEENDEDDEDNDEDDEGNVESSTRKDNAASSGADASSSSTIVGKSSTSKATTSQTNNTIGSNSGASSTSTSSDAHLLGLVPGEGAPITTEDATRKLAQNIMRVSDNKCFNTDTHILLQFSIVGTITSTLMPFSLWLSVFMLVRD